MNDYISSTHMLKQLHSVMSYNNIANRLGISPGSLRGLINRKAELKVPYYLKLRCLYESSAQLINSSPAADINDNNNTEEDKE